MDFYKMLGISRSASDREIKKAYRSLAVKYHPDKNQNDPEAEKKFKEISEAYSVLSDPEKKRSYDMYGESGSSHRRSHGYPEDVFRDFSSFFQGFDFDDMFGSGRPRGSEGRRADIKGDPVHAKCEISIQDVISGIKKSITYNKAIGCNLCSGQGFMSSKDIKSCEACEGSGVISHGTQFMRINSTCPRCNGSGSLIVNPCKECHGKGAKNKSCTIKIDIPKGIDAGMQLRVSDQGSENPGSNIPGDLFVDVIIKIPSGIERNGPHVYLDKKISFYQAVLGDRIQVKTLDGIANVHVVPGTQHGSMTSLDGLGLPEDINSDDRGHFYIRFCIDVPLTISEKERKLLESLKNMHM